MRSEQPRIELFLSKENSKTQGLVTPLFTKNMLLG